MKIKKKTIMPSELETPGEVVVKSTAKTGLDGRFWDMERDGVTQSMIALFALCPQKAEHKLIDGLETHGVKDHGLDFGSFFHDTLDKVYSTQKDDALFNFSLDKIVSKSYTDAKKKLESADIRQKQEFEITYGTCQVVLRQYFNRWAKDDGNMNWVAVEQEFAVPYTLRNGVTIKLRGKVDGIYKDKKNNLYLFETKTKSQIEGNYFMESIGYNLQIMVYMLAIKVMYGVYPKGILYNLVKRPGQKFTGKFRTKAESIPEYVSRIDEDITARRDEYFLRYNVAITEQELLTYIHRDFDYIVEKLYEWQSGGVSSFRNSASCSAWNRPCEYLPLCSGMQDRSSYRKRLSIFPELSLTGQ